MRGGRRSLRSTRGAYCSTASGRAAPNRQAPSGDGSPTYTHACSSWCAAFALLAPTAARTRARAMRTPGARREPGAGARGHGGSVARAVRRRLARPRRSARDLSWKPSTGLWLIARNAPHSGASRPRRDGSASCSSEAKLSVHLSDRMMDTTAPGSFCDRMCRVACFSRAAHVVVFVRPRVL